MMMRQTKKQEQNSNNPDE